MLTPKVATEMALSVTHAPRWLQDQKLALDKTPSNRREYATSCFLSAARHPIVALSRNQDPEPPSTLGLL